jgi:hypothetical protein
MFPLHTDRHHDTFKTDDINDVKDMHFQIPCQFQLNSLCNMLTHSLFLTKLLSVHAKLRPM